MVFRKWPISFVALDNTLDKSLFPGKNHPLNILQPSFPHRGHTFSVGYAHPAVGPGAPSSSPPFMISSHPIKRFSKSCFGRPDFLSSANNFGCLSRTNRCTPPQTANLCESCLVLGTRIAVRHFLEICDQESVILVDTDVHLGYPDLFKARRQIF